MKRSRFARLVLSVGAAVLVGAFAGCGSSSVTGQVPQVLAIVDFLQPNDKATNVSVDSAIVVFFKADISREAQRLVTITVERDGRQVAGQVLLNANRIRFVPATRLSGHTLYRCSMPTTVTLRGGALEREYLKWSITTGDSTPLPDPDLP